MKFNLFKIFIFFKKNKAPSSEHKTYNFTINKTRIPEMKILGNKNNYLIYNELKELMYPQYNFGYLTKNKQGFNTLLFKQSYDILVCDKDGKVLDVLKSLRPNFISKYYNGAFYIYFFPVGTNSYYELKKNDVVNLRYV
jgi:hypothetical protein